MQKILRFVPVQITFFLILGIIIGSYNRYPIISYLPIVLLILLAVLIVQLWRANTSFSQNFSINFTTYLLSFFIGVSTIIIHNELNDKSHYSHFLMDENSSILSIEKQLKSGNYHHKYEASVVKLNDVSTMGKILLNVEKDSSYDLKVDEKLYVVTEFSELTPPMNPYYFDYKKYLKKKNIYHQVFVTSHQIYSLPSSNYSLRGLAAKLRLRINNTLVANNFKGDELAVINALLLGQRQDISPQLISSYTGAGAIHILAVSGLHVGIILLILNFLLNPIERIKFGKLIKLVLIIFLLWSFAFIAGLSASVVRAVTMFTAVAIGMQLKRRTNVYNTLTISMFFLLLFNPYFLFEVGFQLSYLAVFSIVWIQPLLYRMWKPKWKLIDYFWKLLTVSVAAQFGIIPISLYYFHQIPGLFFASNLIIIPVLGTILLGGIIVILLALLQALPDFIASIYNNFIQFMNSVVNWIALQEEFLIQNISFSLLMVVSSYFIIVFGVRFFAVRKPARFILFCIAIISFQTVLIYEKKQLESSDELVVFHKSRFSMIANKRGKNITVYHTFDSATYSSDKILNQYKIGIGNSRTILVDSTPNLLEFDKKRVLVIDSLGVYQIKDYHPDIILIQQSPKINMVRLIDSLAPKMIVVDGSNYKSYIKRWKETSEQKNTPFHYTGQDGAFILKGN